MQDDCEVGSSETKMPRDPDPIPDSSNDACKDERYLYFTFVIMSNESSNCSSFCWTLDYCFSSCLFSLAFACIYRTQEMNRAAEGVDFAGGEKVIHTLF